MIHTFWVDVLYVSIEHCVCVSVPCQVVEIFPVKLVYNFNGGDMLFSAVKKKVPTILRRLLFGKTVTLFFFRKL